MKKNIIIIIIMLFVCTSIKVNGQQQIGVQNQRYKQVLDLKEKGLLVVLPDNPKDSLNRVIKKAMEDNWSFCNVEYITESEVSSYEQKEEHYIFSVFAESMDGKHISDWVYDLKRISNSKIDKVCCLNRFGLPVKFIKDAQPQLLEYGYLIPFIVRYMENSIEFDYESKGSNKAQSDRNEKNNAVLKKFKTMKVYYNLKTDCPDNTKKALEKFDKIPFNSSEFVDIKEFIKIIKSEDENNVIYINGSYYSVKDASRISGGFSENQNLFDCSWNKIFNHAR